MKFRGLSSVVSGECGYERTAPIKSRGHGKPRCWGGPGYHPVLRTARGNSANQRSGCGQPRTTAVERGCQGAGSSVVERWDANGAVPSDARSETTRSTAPPRLLRPQSNIKVA